MASLFDATAPALAEPADGFEFFMDETGFETYGRKGPRAQLVDRPYAIASADKDGRIQLVLNLTADATAKALDLWGGTCDVIFNPVTCDLGIVSGTACKLSAKGRKGGRGLVSISKLAQTFRKARGEHRYYVYDGRWLVRNDGEPVYAMKLAETAEKL